MSVRYVHINISIFQSTMLFIMWKRLVFKIAKTLWKSWCPGKYRNDVRPGGLVPPGTCPHFPLCSPAFHVQSRICWLRRSRTRLYVHRRIGAQFYLRSIVYKRAKTIPVAAIYMRATWRHGEIIYVAKSNSPVWRPGSCIVPERRTRTRRRGARGSIRLIPRTTLGSGFREMYTMEKLSIVALNDMLKYKIIYN